MQTMLKDQNKTLKNSLSDLNKFQKEDKYKKEQEERERTKV